MTTKYKNIIRILRQTHEIIESIGNAVSFSESLNPEYKKTNILVKRCLNTLQTNVVEIETEFKKRRSSCLEIE